MKFSEAFVLGETLKRPDPEVWFRCDPETGGVAGCAIFGAALAAGFSMYPIPTVNTVFDLHEGHARYVDRLFDFVYAQWPWLTPDNRYWVSQLYCMVCNGTISFESMIDWLHELEPIEATEPPQALPVGDALLPEVLSTVL